MNTPWYKQFWPWFLIFVPVITVIMGGVLMYFATSTQDSLVIDDYYKEGKAINASLDKETRAKTLNITTELNVDGDRVAVTFHSGIPADGSAILITFYHVTLEALDTSLLLTRDAAGVYRGVAERPLEGKWRVTLSPLNEEWKIQNTLLLPLSQPVSFNP
ncbi:FixH family protein [Alteromonas sp. C1M14]|uniref:FixH family protein n=1 Tax=Alteromonas sp. C1M14 TaxID=2841567 RepID=UPI001C086AE2|nr:FixH family protein [Alteromonas sp. C1M14]